MAIYDVSGNVISSGGGSAESRTEFPWLNLAHKGTAPEQYGNSLYSFNRSHALGFDGVETDVRMTADGVIVMSHDAEVTGTDSSGTQQSLTIVNSNYEDLAELTLFTLNGVDYHLLTLNEVLDMAFYWNWQLQLDLKSQGNTTDCIVECAKLVRDYGMIGKVTYSGWQSNIESVVSYDPLARFQTGYGTDIPTSIYANIPLERIWASMNRSSLPADVSTLNRNRPLEVWDVGAAQASTVMGYHPNIIQWTGDTDGVSLSKAYLESL